ncbi:hypothetical protein CU048_06385 [Beijerinckiaceae bacterium]|nr:hypothetical protein CU048_06385 [Beijerinckiaceae bacterium]
MRAAETELQKFRVAPRAVSYHHIVPAYKPGKYVLEAWLPVPDIKKSPQPQGSEQRAVAVEGS